MSFFTGARTFHRFRASTEVAIKGLEPLRSAFERKKKKQQSPSAADQDSKKGRKELDRRHKNRDVFRKGKYGLARKEISEA